MAGTATLPSKSLLPLAPFAHNWVGGDIHGLAAFAGTLYGYVPGMADVVAALNRQVGQIVTGASWQGAAARAFTANWEQVSAEVNAVGLLVIQTGSIVDQLAATLAMIENALENAATETAAHGVQIGPNGQPPSVDYTNATQESWRSAYATCYEQCLAAANEARAQAAGDLINLTSAATSATSGTSGKSAKSAKAATADPSDIGTETGEGNTIADLLADLLATPTAYSRDVTDKVKEAERASQRTGPRERDLQAVRQARAGVPAWAAYPLETTDTAGSIALATVVGGAVAGAAVFAGAPALGVAAGIAAGGVLAYGWVGGTAAHPCSDPGRRRMGLLHRTASKLSGKTTLLLSAPPGDALLQAARLYDPEVRAWHGRLVFGNGVLLFGPVPVTPELEQRAGLPTGMMVAYYIEAALESHRNRRPHEVKQRDGEKLVQGLADRLGGTVRYAGPPPDLTLAPSVWGDLAVSPDQVIEVLRPYDEGDLKVQDQIEDSYLLYGVGGYIGVTYWSPELYTAKDAPPALGALRSRPLHHWDLDVDRTRSTARIRTDHRAAASQREGGEVDVRQVGLEG